MHVFERWMQESSMPNELQHELEFIMCVLQGEST